ncbi:MAG: hypothetical protein COA94_03185 [Rickettsiales bacterium]|nr:MAG: hypothetical protein COA94_03185 [Rickettsiales bacterium]
MNQEIVRLNIETIARQRNVFLLLAMLAISCSLALSVKLVSTHDRVILVPGLNQEVWTSGKGVSSSYLEEVSAMYLPLLLDLDAASIEWKKEHLMPYVSQSDPSYMKNLGEYFARVKARYKKFTLSTHFALKSLESDQVNLTVKASGQLISRFGERGFKTNPAEYMLSFEWVNGRLLLREFAAVSKEKEEK